MTMRGADDAGAPIVLRGLVPAGLCARWRAQALAGLDDAAADGTAPGEPPRRPTSLRLAALPELQAEVDDRLAREARLAQALRQALGAAPLLLASQCWLRHQPAPRHRGAHQTPHHWHQDGALAFDFLAQPPPYPGDALLPLVTCWIALTPCGHTAPSLQWASPSPRHLVAPADLMAQAGRAARRHARLDAGDALLFDGALLHATHADEAMAADRTSLELRWLPSGPRPPRLAAEIVVPWPMPDADAPQPMSAGSHCTTATTTAPCSTA